MLVALPRYRAGGNAFIKSTPAMPVAKQSAANQHSKSAEKTEGHQNETHF